MNTKEIQLPEGWIVDKVENGKIILKEESLPTTWKDCMSTLIKREVPLQFNDGIKIYTINKKPTIQDVDTDSIVIPAKYMKAMTALHKLLVCYTAWIGKWEPTPGIDKYAIYKVGSSFRTVNATYITYLFNFPTIKMAENFRDTFSDLLEEAKILL
jgi:hypothetical protein